MSCNETMSCIEIVNSSQTGTILAYLIGIGWIILSFFVVGKRHNEYIKRNEIKRNATSIPAEGMDVNCATQEQYMNDIEKEFDQSMMEL